MTDRGNWIQTFTGKRFYPISPEPGDVVLDDIAHALSMLCRYGGHAHRFYSVAEHSVLMSRAVSPENALWALFHDAAEAYIVDVPRPVKQYLYNYKDIENGILTAIATRFDLPGNFPLEVKEADSRIMLTERAVVMPNTTHKWDIEHLEPLPVEIGCWSPRRAESAFWGRYMELTFPRLGNEDQPAKQ